MPNPILQLNPPFHGLSAIVNVSNRVGPKEINAFADVKVVQKLIRMSAKGTAAKIGIPVVSGNYDAATGFWIYHIQAIQKAQRPMQVVDGIVSPAKGSSYVGDVHWAIVLFNALAKDNSPNDYATFLSSGGDN